MESEIFALSRDAFFHKKEVKKMNINKIINDLRNIEKEIQLLCEEIEKQETGRLPAMLPMLEE